MTRLTTLSEADSVRMHRAAQRRTRRNDHLQACVARGNTVLRPMYAPTRDDGQRCLGHRPKFAVRMRTPFMDSVTRLRVGSGVADDVLRVLVEASNGPVSRV